MGIGKLRTPRGSFAAGAFGGADRSFLQKDGKAEKPPRSAGGSGLYLCARNNGGDSCADKLWGVYSHRLRVAVYFDERGTVHCTVCADGHIAVCVQGQ